jgi:glycosyltransferase involved in cell wall biosynthesis
MPDYVNSDCGWLIPEGNVETVVELIKQLCANKDIARCRREKARAQALKFDWQKIAERMAVVYSAVQVGRSPSAAVKEFERL